MIYLNYKEHIPLRCGRAPCLVRSVVRGAGTEVRSFSFCAFVNPLGLSEEQAGFYGHLRWGFGVSHSHNVGCPVVHPKGKGCYRTLPPGPFSSSREREEETFLSSELSKDLWLPTGPLKLTLLKVSQKGGHGRCGALWDHTSLDALIHRSRVNPL